MLPRGVVNDRFDNAPMIAVGHILGREDKLDACGRQIELQLHPMLRAAARPRHEHVQHSGGVRARETDVCAPRSPDYRWKAIGTPSARSIVAPVRMMTIQSNAAVYVIFVPISFRCGQESEDRHAHAGRTATSRAAVAV